jgi:hypothetical protein
MTTSTDLVKQALAWAGTRTTITSITDGSNEANMALAIYAPLRDFLLREGDYDWAAKEASLTLILQSPDIWTFSYAYPADCLRVRRLISPTFNPLDPLPLEYNVMNVGGVRQIRTQVAAASIIYTFPPVEDVFDPIFTQSFVKLLGSGLMFGLENRIDASDNKLREALTYAGIADLRDS